MLNYLQYLLKDYDMVDKDMINARKVFIVDDNSPDVLINAVIDSKMMSYILPIVDYKIERSSKTSDVDLLSIGKNVAIYSVYMSDKGLKNIYTSHFSPIYRVAAYITDFLIRADRIYNANNADTNTD